MITNESFISSVAFLGKQWLPPVLISGVSSCIWAERESDASFSWLVKPVSCGRGRSLTVNQWLSIIFLGKHPWAF